jgi:hypothetical protein
MPQHAGEVRVAHTGDVHLEEDRYFGDTVLNRPICFFRIFSASDLKSNRLAGLKAFIWSNLCTRHIPNKLTPRGHEDWPDKRRSVWNGLCLTPSAPASICSSSTAI